MEFDLFHNNLGRKSRVLRFTTYEAAKNHAVSMFGEIVAEDADEDFPGCVDIFTVRGEILSIEAA